jgi:hypothetical protein
VPPQVDFAIDNASRKVDDLVTPLEEFREESLVAWDSRNGDFRRRDDVSKMLIAEKIADVKVTEGILLDSSTLDLLEEILKLHGEPPFLSFGEALQLPYC